MHYIKRMSIVDTLALQIAEQMVPVCRATCAKEPDKIVENLLSIDTVRPILDTLRNKKGTRVNFKSTWNPILNARITAVKMVPTQRFVEFLNSNEVFKTYLTHVVCVTAANGSDADLANKLARSVATMILEPYNNYIVELFELNAASSGGRRTRKQKHRRHKTRGHKTRGSRRHNRHSTRKHY